jgi:hypothetical protein
MKKWRRGAIGGKKNAPRILIRQPRPNILDERIPRPRQEARRGMTGEKRCAKTPLAPAQSVPISTVRDFSAGYAARTL